MLLDGRRLQSDVQQGGAGHCVWRWRRRRRWSSWTLIVHTVGKCLHQGLRTRRVGGRDCRLKTWEGSSRRGALAGKISCGGWWCWWRWGRWWRSTLWVILRKRSRSSLCLGLVLRLSREQRPLAAVGWGLRLRLGRVEEGRSRVVDRRRWQRSGMQLCWSQRSRLRSCRLGRVWRPRLTIAIVFLCWSTGRLGKRSRRAGLRVKGAKVCQIS